ncbi:Pyridoxamine 5''-phosphate oxidase [Halovivax ruber XH-70]|uniref:Pyridoxamine 5''-phosphate oxidase n=1 Tax=Halovivax ruber (strain DSM 18193 / JCM 13892 / XH-70) TaxID=797302 RepID=L0IDJ7_HALRX|nr:pyridoxamine 5'-phosphate oxidase family protein [Halovivax ruber]AGB16819.1 Pyridoxamine 5''-phosphate oxidase [Halovivax ruber XH-70]
MTEFRGTWSEDDVEIFLQETTVPIRLATHRPDGSLWVVTLWYRYRDGVFECATQADAAVAGFLRNDPSVAFDVSTNRVPYSGIRGNGTVTISTDGARDTLQELVERYLDGTDSSLAQWLLDDEREEVRIRIEPSTIYSWDYAERMRDVSATDA